MLEVIYCEENKDWMIVSGEEAMDYGFKTKEEAEKELEFMESERSYHGREYNVEGALI